MAALLRLRIPALGQAALVRELHTYGRQVSLEHRRGNAFQHRGFGKRLMYEAERIARVEFGRSHLSVIAGVGVREYYRKLGYELKESYMVKILKQ